MTLETSRFQNLSEHMRKSMFPRFYIQKALVPLKDLEAFEDVGSSGTSVGFVFGTCHSCKSSRQ